MMGRILEYKTAWAIGMALTAYIITVAITPYTPRGTALRGIFLVLSGWGCFAYWRPFWNVVKSKGWPDGAGLYAIMVFLFCTSVNVNIANALFWRGAGQPYFLINNALFDLWIVLGIGALTIAVSVPDLFGKDVPPRDKIQLGTAWLVMFVLVLYLVTVQPDLRPLAEMVRPLYDSGHTYGDADGDGKR